ncbi:hypothetical protein, partial [Cronobacter sakazakii]
YRMAGARRLPALQNATLIAWRVRFAYSPYKTPPLSHGGCALLIRPTKRHPYRMAGALCLSALQNATLIVGWVSAAHPPFLCPTINPPSEAIAKMYSRHVNHHLYLFYRRIAH